MKIEIQQFGGMAPRIDPTKLKDTLATRAHNVTIERGSLTGNPITPVTLPALSNVNLSSVRTLMHLEDGTILGTSDSNAGPGAFRSLVSPRDTFGRIYFSSTNGLRVIYGNANVTPGVYNTLPMSHSLGIPQPSSGVDVSEVNIDPDYYTLPTPGNEFNKSRVNEVFGPHLRAFFDARDPVEPPPPPYSSFSQVNSWLDILYAAVRATIIEAYRILLGRAASELPEATFDYWDSEFRKGINTRDFFLTLPGEMYENVYAHFDTFSASFDEDWRTTHRSVAITVNQAVNDGETDINRLAQIAADAHNAHEGRYNEDQGELDMVTVQWTYTLVDGYGHESAPPRGVSQTRKVPINAQWRVALSGIDTSPLNDCYGGSTDKLVRFYRATYDGSASTFQYVGEITLRNLASNGGKFFDGDLPASGITLSGASVGAEMEPLMSEDWFPPPEGIRGVTAIASNYLAGFENNILFYSGFKLPHAWPTEYTYPLEYEIVALAALDNGIFIGTKGKPYWASGADPASAIPMELNVNAPCLAKDSVVNLNGRIVYASADGLVAIVSGNHEVITQDYITREDWLRDFVRDDMIGFVVEGQYYFSVGNDWWMFSPGIGFFTVDIGGIRPSDVGSISYDPRNDRVVIIAGGTGYSLAISAGYEPMVWHSKHFKTNPTNFSCGRVRATAYPVTFSLETDHGVFEHVTHDDGVFRLPPHRSQLWKLGVTTPEGLVTNEGDKVFVQRVGIAQSPAEFDE